MIVFNRPLIRSTNQMIAFTRSIIIIPIVDQSNDRSHLTILSTAVYNQIQVTQTK